jgi:hypothetical protein
MFNHMGSAICGRLTGVGGTVVWGSRVYDQQAPQNAVLPYVVFTWIGGGRANETPYDSFDIDYQVVCVASSLADARRGAEHISQALTDIPLSVPGYTMFRAAEGDGVARVDNLEGRQYWQRGAEYTFRLSE